MSEWITPPQVRLKALFEYDEEAGGLVWKERPRSAFKEVGAFKSWNTKFAGKRAGGISVNGYLRMGVNGARYMGHRLIWTLLRGDIPGDMQIDHIDGNPSNNKIENLRLATAAVNAKNQKRRSDNTSGVTGVYWRDRDQKWHCQPMLNGKRRYIGVFVAKEDAAAAVAIFYKTNGFTTRHAGVSA